MTVQAEQVTVYWVPGCGNCTRLKGYLTERGIDFVPVDVQSDAKAFEEMQAAGVKSMPSVRVGDRWATGFDLDQVDDLLGLKKDPAGRRLSIEELVERGSRFLEAASRLSRQIPKEHWNDPTPTMDRFSAPILFMDDGVPYVPHHDYKSLVHHLAGHGEKVKRLLLSADGIHELGFAWEMTGEDAAFGEPDLATPMYRVADQMDLCAKDLRAWLRTTPPYDASVICDTHYGKQTLHQLVQTQTCSLAQHNRQLAEVVGERLGLQPDGPIAQADLEGLLMPKAIWGQ
jgi:glutaredoxin